MPSHGRLTPSSRDTRTTVELMSHVITEKGKRNASHEIFSGSASGESKRLLQHILLRFGRMFLVLATCSESRTFRSGNGLTSLRWSSFYSAPPAQPPTLPSTSFETANLSILSGVDGNEILRPILKKQDGMVLTGWLWLRI